MKTGDWIICYGSYNAPLTLGKRYWVFYYEPKFPDIGGFTWPAYVTVRDDDGNVSTFHAHRFKVVP